MNNNNNGNNDVINKSSMMLSFVHPCEAPSKISALCSIDTPLSTLLTSSRTHRCTMHQCTDIFNAYSSFSIGMPVSMLVPTTRSRHSISYR